MPSLPLLSVVLVCALVPAGVRAQAPLVAPAEGAPAAPPLVPAGPELQEEPPPEPQDEPPPRFSARPPSSRMHGVPRVGLELVTGTVGTLAGAFSGLLVSVALRGEPWCLNGSDDD